MAYARASNKDIGAILAEATGQKWSVTGGGSSHYILRCPRRCRCQVTVSSSGSNRIAFRRIRTYLNNHTCWKESNK